MGELTCSHCKAKIVLPDGYEQPMIKCCVCGNMNKSGLGREWVKYKVLGVTAKNTDYNFDDNSDKFAIAHDDSLVSEGDTDQEPKYRVSLSSSQSDNQSSDTKDSKSKNDSPKFSAKTKQVMRDALGAQGLEMLYEMVAGYLSEFDERRARQKRNRVLRTLMKSKVSGSLAAEALEYAEKAPETREIMKDNHIVGIKTGLIVFFVGVTISTVVHFLAHPGRGFILFQIPFAVGLAYAFYSAANLISMKYESLRSTTVNYAIIGISIFTILLYVAWGFFF